MCNVQKMLNYYYCYCKMGEQKNIILIEVVNIKIGNFWVIFDLKCLSIFLLCVFKYYKLI